MLSEKEIPCECLLFKEPLSPEKVEQVKELLKRYQENPVMFKYVPLVSIALPSRARRLLHKLGWCYWTRWSEFRICDNYYSLVYLSQERTCLICNKKEVNELR